MLVSFFFFPVNVLHLLAYAIHHVGFCLISHFWALSKTHLYLVHYWCNMRCKPSDLFMRRTADKHLLHPAPLEYVWSSCMYQNFANMNMHALAPCLILFLYMKEWIGTGQHPRPKESKFMVHASLTLSLPALIQHALHKPAVLCSRGRQRWTSCFQGYHPKKRLFWSNLSLHIRARAEEDAALARQKSSARVTRASPGGWVILFVRSWPKLMLIVGSTHHTAMQFSIVSLTPKYHPGHLDWVEHVGSWVRATCAHGGDEQVQQTRRSFCWHSPFVWVCAPKVLPSATGGVTDQRRRRIPNPCWHTRDGSR